MVTAVLAETAPVEMLNVALVAPADIVRLAGTCTAGLLLDRVTVAPPAGAPLFNMKVPVACWPPTTWAGLIARPAGRTGVCGLSVAMKESEPPPLLAPCSGFKVGKSVEVV
jgi:hypothetical protein